MIPDSLFLLLKVPFPSSQSHCFSLLKVPFSFSPSPVSSSSESISHPLRLLSFISKSSPSPPQTPVPVLFKVLSHHPRPLPSSSKPKKTAERHEAVPPFGVWLVPKWNMTSSYLFMVMMTSVGSSSSHLTSWKHFLSISK